MLSYRHKKHTDNIPMEDFDMKAKFYICNHCGNLVTTIHNAGVPLVCCGEKMKELVPNTVEARAPHGGCSLYSVDFCGD